VTTTQVAKPFEGRTAIVTGAASGIGRSITTRLANDGAHVLLIDRDADATQCLAADVGGDYLIVDLSMPETLDDLSLDAEIVVHCAGLQYVAPIEQFPPGQFALMQRVMVESPFRLTRMVLPAMYERGWGRIVHVSSAHGHRGSAYKSAYVAAKHAIEGLSKVIALEGAPHGVTSNTVVPGYVRTPMVADQIAAQAVAHGISEDQVVTDVLLSRSAVRRLIEPDEVAAAVAYLCGPGSDSITGSSLVLDGGWTAA
jgi:3-hydroxybutyrate dehydrogenase